MNGTSQRKRTRTCGANTLLGTRNTAARTGPRRKGRARGKRSTRVSMRSRKKRRTPSIRALANKVAWNSQKLHGALQTNLQTVSWADTGDDIRSQYPLLMDLTNFTSDNTTGNIPDAYCAAIRKMYSTGPGYAVGQVGHWARKDFKGLTSATQYCAFNKGNADVPDTGKYFAVSSSYRFKFKCRGTCRLRIQIFTVRTGAITPYSTFQQLQLPTSLDGLGQMCDGNFLHRKYFKVYKDISKVIDPLNDQTSGNFVIELGFHHNKLIIQELTNPAVAPTNPQGTLAPGTPTQGDGTGIYNVVNGNWFEPVNLTQGTPLWCLISSDNPGAPTNTQDVNKLSLDQATRVVKWRDHVG